MKSGVGPAFALIFAGAYIGGIALFFGGGLLLGTLGILPIFGRFNNWIYFSFSVGSLVGGLAGFLVYLRFRQKG